MGCGGSIEVSPGSQEPYEDIVKLIESVQLNFEQKYLIRETWKFIEISKKEIGVSVYKRFLTLHPKMKQQFSEFRNIKIEDIDGSYGHPKRLLMAIDNAVTAMGDSESFSAYLIELGRRHSELKFKPNSLLFKDLRKCFLSAIMEILVVASFWNTDVENAWNALFNSITRMMLRGMEPSSLY